MKPWLMTDTPFGHDKVVTFCNRPKDHEQRIFKHLKQLTEKDLLIHLGDICVCNDQAAVHETYIRPLKAKKILIRGNHDRKSDAWYYDHGWDFVCTTYSGIFFKQMVTFSHMPLIKPLGINIHGHFHNAPKERWEINLRARMTDKHYLLSVEDEKYRPIKLETILQRVEKRSGDFN